MNGLTCQSREPAGLGFTWLAGKAQAGCPYVWGPCAAAIQKGCAFPFTPVTPIRVETRPDTSWSTGLVPRQHHCLLGNVTNVRSDSRRRLIAFFLRRAAGNQTERRLLRGRRRPFSTLNPIDRCWALDRRWRENRQHLASCALGFGREAIGGRDGKIYVVVDGSDDNPVNPRPGTLRHAVIQDEPLWIIFRGDMVIQLKEELIMNSFKTIDGRGARVEIAHGACITIQFVEHVIIHGVSIHHCRPTGNAMVRSSPRHVGWRTMADGDGISIFGSSHVWIDHNSLAYCADGLVDAVMMSTRITISNNYFSHHNEVMLFGHSDTNHKDAIMQITVAYNHFGEDLIQRMPRCRLGYFEVFNNLYSKWEMYAIGGSANPTINSQGNIYVAPNDSTKKQVTMRHDAVESEWKNWNWRSVGDQMLNGAFFVASGGENISAFDYSRVSETIVFPSSMVRRLIRNAGPLVLTD